MKINEWRNLLLGLTLFFLACKNESSDVKFPEPKLEPCDSIKFSKHIKPILIRDCATSIGCHGVASATGDFSEYTSVLPYITNGALEEHVLILGDMPKGGSKLPQKELDYFRCWLDKGGLNN